jgi:hypothetical protein
LSAIESGYNGISSDLSTYVTNLSNGLEQGAIDPADILSSADIVNQFANSNEQSRPAAELPPIGAAAPKDEGYQALISHPDLEFDQLWAWVYPRFSGDPVSLSPGTTLAASDYNMAYIGYYGEASGEFQTQTLSGDSPLEIIDTTGIEGEDEYDVEENDSIPTTVKDSGRVVVWEGEDPPPEIQYPADHEGHHIVVDGAAGRTTHPVSDVQYDEETGEYYIPASDSSLAAGEAVERVITTPEASYQQPVTHVSDPTSVDSEQTVQELKTLRETVSDLEEAFNSSGAGGSIGELPSLPGWIPGTGMVQWAVVGVAAFLGIQVIDASSG